MVQKESVPVMNVCMPVARKMVGVPGIIWSFYSNVSFFLLIIIAIVLIEVLLMA